MINRLNELKNLDKLEIIEKIEAYDDYVMSYPEEHNEGYPVCFLEWYENEEKEKEKENVIKKQTILEKITQNKKNNNEMKCSYCNSNNIYIFDSDNDKCGNCGKVFPAVLN